MPRSSPSPLPFLLAPLLLVSNTALAGDPAAAEALFHEAKDLMAQGRYREACPKFEESQRSDAGLGTQFHLADCWQHLGRTATAWALFREVESGARALGQTSRERVAHNRAVALEPFLSKIVIAPHDAAATTGLEIRRDGAALGREQWDVPVPVDPGTHAVSVSAPHKQPWQTDVEIPADGRVTTVDVPPLDDVEPPPPVVQAPQPSAPPAPPPALPPKGVASAMPPGAAETAVIEDSGAAQRAIGWTLVGAGVVSLAAGVYFGAQWIDDRSLIDAPCSGASCDNLRQDARTQGTRAEWLLAGGGASFLVGALVVATAPRPRVVIGAAQLEIAPILDRQTGGLAVRGAW
ncbi:MAG: hypothetical protein WBY94_02400 [Polyangiaceae bacterium]